MVLDFSARPAVLVAAVGATTRWQHTALIVNAVAETLNGVTYISPLRNAVAKSLFGIEKTDLFSPIAGAFMYLGGLHAAVAVQCVAAVLGLRSAIETLKLMIALHAFQAAIGLFRAIKTTTAGKLATPTVDAFLGAGGGPATGALLLGLVSLSAIL